MNNRVEDNCCIHILPDRYIYRVVHRIMEGDTIMVRVWLRLRNYM